MQDLHTKMLSDIADRLEAVREDLSELKETLNTEVSMVKVSQARCESKWVFLEKITTLGIGSVSIGGILTTIFGNHNK